MARSPVRELEEAWGLPHRWCAEEGKGLPSQRKDGKPRKRNAYADKCWFCERPLEPGDGCIEKGSDGEWRVYCLAGLPVRSE